MTSKMFKLASLALVAGFVTLSLDSVGMKADSTQSSQQSMSSKIEIVSFNNDGKEGREGGAPIKFYMQYSSDTTKSLSCNINLNDPLKSVKNLFDVIADNMPSTNAPTEFIKSNYKYGIFINDNAQTNAWILFQAAAVYNDVARECGLRTIDKVKFAGDLGWGEIPSTTND